MRATPSIEYFQLVTQHQVAVYCFVRSIAPGLNDVEDVVQEVNILLWQKASSFTPGTNFKAFAFRIAYLKTMEAIRKKMRRNRPASALTDEAAADAVSEYWQDRPNLGLERIEALESCIGKLPDTDRALLMQRYEDGKSVREIAHGMNAGEGSLQQRFFRLRKALRTCVENFLKKTAEES